MGKTPDFDHPSQFLPAMALDQMGDDHLQRNAVQRVIIKIMNYKF